MINDFTLTTKEEILNQQNTPLRPPIPSKLHTLPYNDLDWKSFEFLCLRLAYELNKESSKNDIILYKKEGLKQDGIDICHLIRGTGKYNVYQCKRYRNGISHNEFINAIDLIKDNSFWGSINDLYFCTSSDLSSLDKLIYKYQEDLHKEGINFYVWDPKRLDFILKDHPQIVYEYFDGGRDKYYVTAFSGAEKARMLFSNRPKLQFEPVENYIKRKLIKADYASGYRTSLTEKSLTDIFNEGTTPVRILLKSIAGNGKTLELKNLAYTFSIETSPSSLFPIYIQLKYVKTNNLETILKKYCPDIEHINPSRLLVILDGFDEIKDNLKDHVQNEIRLLADSKRDVNIIISSRQNGLIGHFDGFDEYTLPKLDFDKGVYEYIVEQLQEKADSFNSLLYHYKFKDLIESPFYLVHLTQIFKEKPHDFPTHRNQVFDRIIKLFNTREKESEKYNYEEWDTLEENQDLLLGKLSLTMLMMNLNVLSRKELKLLFDNDSDYNQVLM